MRTLLVCGFYLSTDIIGDTTDNLNIEVLIFTFSLFSAHVVLTNSVTTEHIVVNVIKLKHLFKITIFCVILTSSLF